MLTDPPVPPLPDWIDIERAKVAQMHPAFDPGTCNPAEQPDEVAILTERVDDLTVQVNELRGTLTRLLKLWTEDE